MSEVTDPGFAAAHDALDEILAREPEPDEALRRAVAALVDQIPGYAWAGLHFTEDDALVLGPHARSAEKAARRGSSAAGLLEAALATGRSQLVDGADTSTVAVPVLYDGTPVAALEVQGDREVVTGSDGLAFLERVAMLLSSHCLVGWDTGGEPWSDAV